MKRSKLSRMKQNRLKKSLLNKQDQQQLEKAEKLLARGDLEPAKLILAKLTQTSPLDHRAYHHLATIAAHENRMDDSVNYILEAATRNDTDPVLHSDCGAILNRAGRFMEAEAACRHALSLRNSNEAGNNLAIALQSQGRLDEAMEACEQVLKNTPDFMDSLITMGNLQIRSGQFLTAVEYFAKALQKDPNLAVARANLAVALRELGEIQAAEDQVRTALLINPEYPQAFNVLGTLLIKQGHMDKAIQAFKDALKRIPGFLEARINLAAALFKNMQFEQAITAYQEVILLKDDFAPAHTGLGICYLTTGKISKAVESFRKAVSIDGGYGEAHYNIASALGDKVLENDLINIDNALKINNLSVINRILILFAKAEILDKQLHFNAAFQCFREANQLRRKHDENNDLKFDGDDFTGFTDQLKKSWLANKDIPFGNADASERPVFVVGAPRSGTTLVEQILSRHPNVEGRGEINALASVANVDASGLENLTDEDVTTMTAAIMEKFSTDDESISRVIDKTPFQFLTIGLIRKIFPNARIIVCRRDVMDTGLSCYFQNFIDPHTWATDLFDTGRYLSAATALMDFWQSDTKADVFTVHYEDLIRDTESKSREMLDYLGLDWHPDCLDFDKNDRAVLTASNWQVRKPVYQTAIGRAENYQDHLEPLKKGLANKG